METAAGVRDPACPTRGLLGSSFVGGRMTLFLDVEELLALFELGGEAEMEAVLQGRSP
jgi:hypothetical protein